MYDRLTGYSFEIDDYTSKIHSFEEDRTLLYHYMTSKVSMAKTWQTLSKRKNLVIGFYLKNEGFYNELTVEENFKLFENLTCRQLIPTNELTTLFELDDKWKLPCKKFSKKHYQRMGMALSLIPRPDLAIWESPDFRERQFYLRVSSWFAHNKIILLYS